MLAIKASISGDRIVLEGLAGLVQDFPAAVDMGLVRIAKGTHRESYAWLSGPRRPQMRLTDRRERGGRNKTARRGQSSSLDARPGSYPVPVLTGNLRRLLDWLRPGAAKDGFQAGAHEVVVYDSAEYTSVIHDGEGTSSGHGPRKFLDDGFLRFNQGNTSSSILEEEANKAIKRRGL